MEVQFLANPAEPVVDDGSYGGYAQIARRLTELEPERARPVSRQLVHRWYQRRDYNNFPDKLPVRVKSGKVKTMFSIAEVEDWRRTHRLHHRQDDGKSLIDTIPLF